MTSNERKPERMSPAQEAIERRKRARRGEAPKDRRWLWAGLTIAVLAVVLIGGAALIQAGGDVNQLNPLAQPTRMASVSTPVATSAATTGDIQGLQVYEGLSRQHVEGKVDYSPVPPAGGIHSSIWQNCGIYDQPIEIENALHSLEHGAAWVTYRPDTAPEAIQQLRTLARGKPYTLLSPLAGTSAPIVATAWGLRLETERADDPRLAEFMTKYANGSQTPEPGAVCSGGLGTPIE